MEVHDISSHDKIFKKFLHRHDTLLAVQLHINIFFLENTDISCNLAWSIMQSKNEHYQMIDSFFFLFGEDMMISLGVES